MPLIQNFRYRPEIDGLRAIAVLAVVLYHAGLGVPGGYIGVDIFFVISGYLITSLIVKDLEAGVFSFAHFWERRARRIIPAVTVLVLVVLISGWFLLLPSDYVKLGESAVSQAFFSANIYFWRTTNYFAGPAEEQPLLHTWSLAVEEQYYLAFPFALAMLLKFRRLRSRFRLISIFSVVAAISLFLSIWMLPRMPAATFYLLPSRTWELLLGAIVALLPGPSLTKPLVPLLSALSWAGLAGMVVPCFVYTVETPFPAAAALPPCLGACIFIWSTSKQTADAPLNLPARLLAMRPIVFIGLISYSFYLWHWPFFAFSVYWALEPLSLLHRLALVAIGFFCAVISWRFVETPFRIHSLGTSRRQMFAYAGSGLAVSVAVAMTIVAQEGFARRFSPTVFGYASVKQEAMHENRITKPVKLSDAIAGEFPRLGNADSNKVPVFVWGDSHARSILPAIDQVAREQDVAIMTAWHSSTAPVLDYVPAQRFQGFSLGEESPAFSLAIIDYIQKHQIPSVVLAARWSGYFETDAARGTDARPFGELLIQTVRKIKETGSTPWILMEVPNHKVAIPKALIRRDAMHTDITKFLCTAADLAKQNQAMIALKPEIEAAGGQFIEVSSLLLESKGQHYLADASGDALYYDNHHLSFAGARHVSPAFVPVFSE